MVLYTDMLRVFEDDTIQYWHSPTVMKNKLVTENNKEYQVEGIGIQSSLIRRYCLEKAGIFDEKLPRFIDLELFIRLSSLYLFFHIKEPLVKYYATPGISSDANALYLARKMILEKHQNEIKKERIFFSQECFRVGYLIMRMVLSNSCSIPKSIIFKIVIFNNFSDISC